MNRLCLFLVPLLAAAAWPAPAAEPLAPARSPDPLKDLGRKDKVRLVYFVPSDRRPTANWREKIEVVMTFVNDLYCTSLRDDGYKTRGLDFEFADRKLDVHLVRGRQGAAAYTRPPAYDGSHQYRSVLREVEKALGPAGKNLYVIFNETGDDVPAPFEWRGGLAMGANHSATGGVAMFSAWVLQDFFAATTVPDQLNLLADTTPIRGRKAMGCPRADSPRFEFIEDGFGAVAHELGHALALWHDGRRREYIMGNGFRYLRRNYFPQMDRGAKVRFSPENVNLLARTRFLAEDNDATDTQRPKIDVTFPPSLPAGTKEFEITARSTDDKALAAAVMFFSEGDSVVWGQKLTGASAENTVKVATRPLREGKVYFHFGAIDMGGNFTRADRTIQVVAPSAGGTHDKPAGGKVQ